MLNKFGNTKKMRNLRSILFYYFKTNKTTMLKFKSYANFSKLIFNKFRIGEVLLNQNSPDLVRKQKFYDNPFI